MTMIPTTTEIIVMMERTHINITQQPKATYVSILVFHKIQIGALVLFLQLHASYRVTEGA